MILTCIDHILSYTQRLSFDDFASNFTAVEACLYNIQIIGEAVSQFADDVKEKESMIPWASSVVTANDSDTFAHKQFDHFIRLSGTGMVQ
jgi:uncharacterized protein with HEPN domain